MTRQGLVEVNTERQLFSDKPIIEEIRGLERTLEFCGKGHPAPPGRETTP